MTYRWNYPIIKWYVPDTVIDDCIAGISKEIHRRQQNLWHMRKWYLNPLASGSTYYTSSFYFIGIRTLKELNQLKRIKSDLLKL